MSDQGQEAPAADVLTPFAVMMRGALLLLAGSDDAAKPTVREELYVALATEAAAASEETLWAALAAVRGELTWKTGRRVGRWFGRGRKSAKG